MLPVFINRCGAERHVELIPTANRIQIFRCAAESKGTWHLSGAGFRAGLALWPMFTTAIGDRHYRHPTRSVQSWWPQEGCERFRDLVLAPEDFPSKALYPIFWH